jgi:5'-nucleotidase
MDLPYHTVPLHARVFTNRSLNLNSIQLVGFDMDYTLVLYDELELEREAYRLAVNYLIHTLGYPADIAELPFIEDRVIRGLVIDKRFGTLLKINRFGYIKAALHGEHFLTREEQKNLYGHEIVRLTNPRYEMIHTLFSLAQGCLASQLATRRDLERPFELIYEEITQAFDEIHRNGSLKAKIIANPAQYVRTSQADAQTLLALKATGKRLVLITNSGWEFTSAMMTYAYDRFLPSSLKWRDLFSLVIVDASKPSFFTEKGRFYEVIPETGYLKNAGGSPKLGGIYHGGNALGIERAFQVQPSEILYVGDHIYSDVYKSKKTLQWRTMLVLTDLERELAASESARPLLEEIRARMRIKEKQGLLLSQLNLKRLLQECPHPGINALPAEALPAQIAALKKELSELDLQIGTRISRYNSYFHEMWGETLWAGNDPSHFSHVIERFACIYTSRVSNLLQYGVTHYFRPEIKEPI